VDWRAELEKNWRARASVACLVLAVIVLIKPRALFRGGGGRTVFMPFVFRCRSCGWGLRLELPCNAGPPSIRKKLQELVGVVIPRSCPNCGRVFDLSRIGFGFEGV
jgi:hypothetical protein